MMLAILIDNEVFSVIKITQLPITQQSSHTVYRVISLFRQLTVGVKASVFFTIGNFHDKFLTNIIFIQSSSSFDLCLICVWIYDVHSYGFIFMPHDLGQRLDIHSTLNGACCEGVAQGVEIEFPDSGSFREFFKHILVRADRHSLAFFVFYNVDAPCRFLSFYQHLRDIRWQRNDSV